MFKKIWVSFLLLVICASWWLWPSGRVDPPETQPPSDSALAPSEPTGEPEPQQPEVPVGVGEGVARTPVPEESDSAAPPEPGQSAERAYQLELSRQMEHRARELGYFSLEEREVYDSYSSEVLETLLEEGDIRAYPVLIGRYNDSASLEYLTWASFKAAVHGSTPAIGMLAHLELSQARYEQLMENEPQAHQRLLRSQALYRAADELSNTSDDNNELIRKQSLETEQMATAINEMTASVAEVSRNATSAADATQNADREVETGNHTVQRTAAAIQNLADTLEEATEKVQAVSTQSGDIEKIIEVINAIAEQTNLLALNAAIEAARAGEHGRGFAVVADEVRSLATRTQQSTREISTMIGQLQEGSSSATAVMQTSRELAQNTVEQTRASEQALDSIRREVTAITDMNLQIATAAEEQSQVAEDVNRNITRISDATVASSAGSNQVAASSRELTDLAQQLTRKVSFFNLG